VGWLDRKEPPGPSRGHGSGAGRGAGRPLVATNTCDIDLPLFANANGHIVPVGTVKAGATLRFGSLLGDYTQIQVGDPDVVLESAFVASGRFARVSHR